MLDGRVQIMDVDRIIRDVIAEVIGFTDRQSWFDAAARQPDRETSRVMVAPVIGLGQLALRVYGSTERVKRLGSKAVRDGSNLINGQLFCSIIIPAIFPGSNSGTINNNSTITEPGARKSAGARCVKDRRFCKASFCVVVADDTCQSATSLMVKFLPTNAINCTLTSPAAPVSQCVAITLMPPW